MSNHSDDYSDDGYNADFQDFDDDDQFDNSGGNSAFVEEYYENAHLPHMHRFRHKLRQIVTVGVGILVILFLVFVGLRFWFTLLEPGTYIQANSQRLVILPVKNQHLVAEVTVIKTDYVQSQMSVQVMYLDADQQQHTVCGLVAGDTFSMREDWIEFAGLDVAGFDVLDKAMGFRWIGTSDQFSAAKCHVKGTAQTKQQGDATFGSDDETLFKIVQFLHTPSWLLGATTQSFTTQKITDTRHPQVYDLYQSEDGTLTYQRVQ